MVGLPFSTNPTTTPNPLAAEAVNADGTVVVGAGTTLDNFEAFRWTQAGGVAGLGFLGMYSGVSSSQAQAVNADGTVVVGGGSFLAFPARIDEAFR